MIVHLFFSRHSPSGLPDDGKFDHYYLLVKYSGSSCSVHLHQTARSGRLGWRMCIILVRRPRFSAARTFLSCRFLSPSGSFSVTRIAVALGDDGSDSPSASSSSRITRRPPSELKCAPRNSSRADSRTPPDHPALNPHPLGDPSNLLRVSVNTFICIYNTTVRTAKSADYLGNAGQHHHRDRVIARCCKPERRPPKREAPLYETPRETCDCHPAAANPNDTPEKGSPPL